MSYHEEQEKNGEIIGVPAAELLNLRELPAILNAEQTSTLLFGSCNKDLIAALIREGLLQPLGDPTPQSQKGFATVELFKLRKNLKWLNAAQRCFYAVSRRKNGKKGGQAAQ
jgi:hypothetical protein